MFDYANIIGQLGIPPWALCILIVIMIWSIIWKGIALWKSARNNSPVWFVILLLCNTAGILEILYIFVFSKLECCKTEKTKTRKKRR
jgi:hypothetical protein